MLEMRLTVHRSHIVSLSWAITRGYSWVRHVPWLGLLGQSRRLQILICTIIFLIKPFKSALKRFLLEGSFYTVQEYFDWNSLSNPSAGNLPIINDC